MGKVSEYAAQVVLNEGGYIYMAIDTDSDTVYEAKRVTIASLRAHLFDANGVTFKGTKGSDVASAAALPVTDTGNYFDITGTTAITSIKTIGVGTTLHLHFDGALTLTHHATDLVLPGGVDIETQSGDEAIFIEYATGDWRCVNYQRYRAIEMTPVYMDAAPQALSGPGAVDTSSPVTNVTTTGGTDALTLGDGAVIGQMKTINHAVDGGGYVLTPTTFSNGTTITVTDVGVRVDLMWTSSGWRLVGQTGVATIA